MNPKHSGGSALPWRGIHLLVRSRTDLPDLETIITRHLPQLHLNRLILEVNYHYQFRSHPEVIEDDALTRDDCRRLKQFADANGVKLIPMINCLGHQSWAERTASLLKAHPEFDETPDYPPDNKGIYCRSWCPSNPDVNRVVFALIDEMIEAFDADTFNVGMDEVFILGECRQCKGTPNAQLFAKAVNDLHAHLVGERGVEMHLWGDRLLDAETTGYGKWEASANDTAPAIDLIPKDIVVCDWHYETKYGGVPATYPSVGYFRDKGFRVWPAGWRTEENVRLLATCALEKRSDPATGDRVVGYLATTWGGVASVAGGLAGDPERRADTNTAGLIAALRKGAAMSWEGAPEAS
jgi:hypothetical protein